MPSSAPKSRRDERLAAAQAALAEAETATVSAPPAVSADGGRDGRKPGFGAMPSSPLRDDADEDIREAVAFLLRSTANRPQTETEIAAKLRQRDYPPAVIDAVLAHAREIGAVDDAALASAWVEDRGIRRGYGRARLVRELRRRQVPEGLITEALAPLDDRDDEAAATELAQARLAQLPTTLAPDAVARRLATYLVRRGHPPGLAQRVAVRVSGLDRVWD